MTQTLYFSLTQHRGYEIILTGGRSMLEGKVMSTAYSYDVKKQQWSSLPQMTLKRAYHSSLCIKDWLFVLIGRFQNYKSPDSFEMLNLAVKDRKAWQMTQLNCPRVDLKESMSCLISDSQILLFPKDAEKAKTRKEILIEVPSHQITVRQRSKPTINTVAATNIDSQTLLLLGKKDKYGCFKVFKYSHITGKHDEVPVHYWR